MQKHELERLFEIAGVDPAKGKAKALLEREDMHTLTTLDKLKQQIQPMFATPQGRAMLSSLADYIHNVMHEY